MCIIIVKKKDARLPTIDELTNCERANRDGIGIAFIKQGINEVVIKKDFASAKALHSYLSDNIKVEDTLIIHFRFATHGLKDIGNRHPFPLTEDRGLLRAPSVICNMALAHNGILSQMARHEKYSDTQKFILGIMSNSAIKDNLDNPAIQRLIGDFLGSDKLAILRNDGTLWLFGAFIEDSGLLFSNEGYKPYIKPGLGWQGQQDGWDWGEGWKTTQNNGIICDGCRKTGNVKYIPLDEQTGDGAFLCKKCRGKHKGKAQGKRVKCDNCFNWFSHNEGRKTGVGWLCHKCQVEYNSL